MHIHAKPKPVSRNAVSTRPQRSGVASKEDAPASTVTVNVNLAEDDHKVRTLTAVCFMPTSAVARSLASGAMFIIDNPQHITGKRKKDSCR